MAIKKSGRPDQEAGADINARPNKAKHSPKGMSQSVSNMAQPKIRLIRPRHG